MSEPAGRGRKPRRPPDSASASQPFLEQLLREIAPLATMDRNELVLRIMSWIAAGTLPCVECLVTWYGLGCRRPCVACDQPIPRTDVEDECDLPGGGTILFHSRCYDLWRGSLSV